MEEHFLKFNKCELKKSLQVVKMPFLFAEIKKPGGTAEDIETYFGCSASHLIMVTIKAYALSFLFGWYFCLGLNLLVVFIPGGRSAVHGYCLWKQTWFSDCFNRTIKPFWGSFYCQAGLHCLKIICSCFICCHLMLKHCKRWVVVYRTITWLKTCSACKHHILSFKLQFLFVIGHFFPKT